MIKKNNGGLISIGISISLLLDLYILFSLNNTRFLCLNYLIYYPFMSCFCKCIRIVFWNNGTNHNLNNFQGAIFEIRTLEILLENGLKRFNFYYVSNDRALTKIVWDNKIIFKQSFIRNYKKLGRFKQLSNNWTLDKGRPFSN